MSSDFAGARNAELMAAKSLAGGEVVENGKSGDPNRPLGRSQGGDQGGNVWKRNARHEQVGGELLECSGEESWRCVSRPAVSR